MTDKIIVPRVTWDALVKALVRLKIEVVLSDIPLAYVESHFREHLDIAENAITAANAVSDHFRGVTEMVQPLGWYCVSRDGLATQCADQRDAEVTAESANRDWPNSAPYRAVQLCEFEANPQATEPAQRCWCETCRPVTIGDMRMVVCPECGNKRCPKATHHDNPCTNSNDIGQKGSSWEHVKPAAPEAKQ